jgi:hypothetical protein
MSPRPVAVDRSASLGAVPRFEIGLISESSDERIGVGLDQAGSFFSAIEPSEQAHFDFLFGTWSIRGITCPYLRF